MTVLWLFSTKHLTSRHLNLDFFSCTWVVELRRLTFVLIIALALCMLIYQSFLYFENKDTVVSTTKQMQPGLSVLDGVSFCWTSPMEALISKSTFSSFGFLVSLPVCLANLLDKCKASLVWPQLGLPGYPQRLLSLGLSLQFRSPNFGLWLTLPADFSVAVLPLYLMGLNSSRKPKNSRPEKLDLLRHFDKLPTYFNTQTNMFRVNSSSRCKPPPVFLQNSGHAKEFCGSLVVAGIARKDLVTCRLDESMSGPTHPVWILINAPKKTIKLNRSLPIT